jgi:hypothetical protein
VLSSGVKREATARSNGAREQADIILRAMRGKSDVVLGKLSTETELALRTREGLELIAEIGLNERIPDERAFLLLEGSARPRCDEIREVALRNQRERAAQPRPDKGKDYFIPLFTRDTYQRHPEILELGLDRRLLALASDYIGSLPILRMIQVFWTPRGDGDFKGSQLYHFDRPELGERQLKLMVNLVDVTPEDGPFTFVPANLSAKVAANERPDGGRYFDEQVYRHAPEENAYPLNGPVGTGVFVDTNRCLHYGARSRGKDRLILIAQYVRADRLLKDREYEYIDLTEAAPAQADPLREHALRHHR